MKFFKNRHENTPERPAPAETVVEKLYPTRESGHLNGTVDELDRRQAAFMAECARRGMDAETTAAALRDAMQQGAVSGALSVRLRRDNTRDVFIPHGAIPDGLIEVVKQGDAVSLRVGQQPDGSKWPTAPDPQNPESFYVEHYNVAPENQIGMYGDERDTALAQQLRGLNGQLREAMALPDIQ